MNAYDAGRKVEAQSMAVLHPFLDETQGRWVMTAKGALARYLQETTGDLIFNDAGNRMWTVECKAEKENKTGNLFLEVWSNRNLDRRDDNAKYGSNPGWMLKLRADLLFYHFIDTDDLYIINLFELQRWAFGYENVAGSIWDYPERRQGKYVQANDTWGRCVPISTLQHELGQKNFKHVHPRQIPLFPEAA